MKRVAFLTVLLGVVTVALVTPQESQAVKVKLSPSITLRHSQNYHHPQRRVVREYRRPEVVRYQEPPLYYYDPYRNQYYQYPYEVHPYEVHEYVECTQPYRSCNSGIDYEMKFKFK